MGYYSRRLPLIAALCGLMTLAPAFVSATEVSAAEHGRIRAVIERQLEAFSRDDERAAYAVASPLIQRRAVIGALSEMNGELVQLVAFTGLDGHKVLAVYSMVKDNTGAWRINGCRLLQKDELGA